MVRKIYEFLVSFQLDKYDISGEKFRCIKYQQEMCFDKEDVLETIERLKKSIIDFVEKKE